MPNETPAQAIAQLRQCQRTIRALHILSDRYGSSTLAEMEEVIPMIVIECMTPDAEHSMIEQEALRAIDSPTVQAILPPWRNEAIQKPDERLEGSQSFAV